MNKYIKLMALVAVISNVQIAISGDQDTATSEPTKHVDTTARAASPTRSASPRLTPAAAMPTSPRSTSPASDLNSGTPIAAPIPANTDANSSTTSELTARSWFSMPTMPALRMPTAREAAIGAGLVVTAAALAVGTAKRDDIRAFAKTRLGRN